MTELHAAAAAALSIGQFNLTETRAVVVKGSLLTNGTRGQGKALPPAHSRPPPFPPSPSISLSPSLSLWVVMEMKAEGAGASIIEAVVGLV